MSKSPAPRRRSTLASLAAELKVSRTTISNAYNRPEQLSPELRERVFATARRMGYPGPDPLARSLRTRKAGVIGLVTGEALTHLFSDPAALDFTAGLAQSCEEAGQGLSLIAAGPDRGPTGKTAAASVTGVDGFVVYSVADNDPCLQAVSQRNVAVVVADQPAVVAGAFGVCIDDRAAMTTLAGYVLDFGHREIGLVTTRLDRDRKNGPVDRERLRATKFAAQRQRITGVYDAMAQRGLNPTALTVVEICDDGPTAGATAVEEVLGVNPRTTAVICTADVLALSVIDCLQARGIDVPGQMTVTGFDGVSAALDRGVTTIAQPNRRKGRRAGELLRAGDGVSTPVVEVFDTELIRGRTVAPPAS